MKTLTANEQLILASTVASRAHSTQRRKDGTPYIGHPMRVAMRVADHGLAAMTAALLHDVVEDADVTLADLKDYGFSGIVVDAVDHVTKRKGESYTEFVLRAKEHDLARIVKLADIQDNLSDQSALEPEEAEFLTKRYTKALEVLNG